MLLALSMLLRVSLADDVVQAPAQEPPPFASPAQIDHWLDSVVLLLNGPAWCSGVVIDDQGTVATAYHCVASGLRTKVTTRAGRSAIGRTIAAFPRQDVALISVPELASSAGGPPPLPLRAAPPQVGQRVYGMGHPYAPLADRSVALEGNLLWSVSEGIVSNVGTTMIQTDAALNPGNSGGPVVGSDGEIVGIVSRKLGGDNIAFAVGSPAVEKLQKERTPPGLLGGEISLGTGLWSGEAADAALTWDLRLDAVVRERVFAELSAGVNLDARNVADNEGDSWYPAFSAALAARQRFGRGRWSTTLDAGVQGTVLDGFTTLDNGELLPRALQPLPGAFARIGLGGIGIRAGALWMDGAPAGFLALDVDAPGEVTTF